MNSKVLITLATLALTTSLVDSGCMARSSGVEEITDTQDDLATQVDNKAAEDTGEADQAFWGGWGGFGWGRFGWGGFGWGGFGWGRFGWGGFGWGGFGWGGFGWGGWGGWGRWGGWW